MEIDVSGKATRGPASPRSVASPKSKKLGLDLSGSPKPSTRRLSAHHSKIIKEKLLERKAGNSIPWLERMRRLPCSISILLGLRHPICQLLLSLSTLVAIFLEDVNTVKKKTKNKTKPKKLFVFFSFFLSTSICYYRYFALALS